MNKLTTIRIFLVALTLGISTSILLAQAKFTLAASPTFKINGGSSLHDWEMVSNTAKGEGMFNMEGSQFKGAKSLNVSLEAETLKSGTRGLDSNAYKALNTSKNKDIRFALRELTGSGASYTAKGDLTIAGVTKPVTIPVKMSQSGNRLTFEGSLNTKLTEFSITPPTALMGTVKTRDEVTISFKTTFQPTN